MASNSSNRKRASSSSSSHQQQAKHAKTHGAASNAGVSIPMAGTNGGVAPRSSSAAPATTQMQLLRFVAAPMASGIPPATSCGGGGGGLALAAALCRFRGRTLERMVTQLALLPARRDNRKNGGAAPAWWPTAREPRLGTEVAAHLSGRAMATPVPFAPARRLTKAEKVAVLVAAVNHAAPDFARLAAAAARSRMTELETIVWENALRRERHRYVTMMPPPQPVDFSVSGGGEQKREDAPPVTLLDQHGGVAAPLLERHCDAGNDLDQRDGLSGDLSVEAAAAAGEEDVDWFDCDELYRRMAELEIPSFFGGYYI